MCAFTTKAAGNVITSAWANQVQARIEAIETYTIDTLTVDNVHVLTKIVVHDPADDDGDYIDLECEMVEDTDFPGTYNPVLRISECIWCDKDVFTYGFLGTASPSGGTGGGAVLIGHGLTGTTDPPKIALTDSGTGYDKLLICKVDGSTPANIRAAYYSSDDSAGLTATLYFPEVSTVGHANYRPYHLVFKNGILTAAVDDGE